MQPKKKPGAGIGFLGFLLTFLLTLVLLADGLLIGLKATILKGNDMVDVLKNAKLFETFTEVVVSEVEVMTDSSMLGDVAASVFSEDVLVDVTKDVTEAIKNDEDIDLSHMKDTCMDEIKNVSEGVIDDVLSEIEAGGGELNADTLANNKALQELQAQYGVDISGMVMEYVEQTYGQTSVSVEQVDLEEVKEQAKTTMEEVVMPAMEEAVDEYIVEINAVVNEEIRTITKAYDISGILNTIDKAMALFNKALLILSIACVVLIGFEMLTYMKFMNRGLRNTAIAATISGVFVALVGLLLFTLSNVVIGMLGIATGDMAGEVIVGFIDDNMTNIGLGITSVGGIYIVVAIVCYVFAGILKRKKANVKLVDEVLQASGY